MNIFRGRNLGIKMDVDWVQYRIKNEYWSKKSWFEETILHKVPTMRTNYDSKKTLDIVQTNELIYNYILNKDSFMVGRFGSTEMRTIYSYLQYAHFPSKDNRKQCVGKLCESAGFFPDDILYGKKFVELMLKSCSCIDLCGVWNLYMEDYVLHKYATETQVTFLDNLEPWNAQGKVKPWTAALKGKNVLVVHPFADTINNQYTKYRTKIYEKCFEPDDILPYFNLNTFNAVQTINYNDKNTNYNDWFEALNDMINKIEKINFDVAIIGCGAYGFPLAAAIKMMGKGAIHLGGATQILFGIVGKRWESCKSYKTKLDQVRNEYWTRPSFMETPDGAEKIEGGCYW